MTRGVRERLWLVVPTALLALAVAAACAGRDDGDSTTNAEAADAGNGAGVEVDAAEGATASEDAGGEATDDAAGGAEGELGGDGEGGAGPLELDIVAIAQAREVVRTGTMRLTVDDVDASASDVRRLAAEAGGFVADEQVRARDDEVDMTVRVPAARFDDVRGAIGELGDVAAAAPVD
ncbi:MAG: DUF4349 domain-containing protein [Acidimicrobiales bacterium]